MDSSQMKRMWNKRAQVDAFYYVETALWEGNIDAFFDVGEQRAQELIDPVINQTPLPKKNLSALEVGCGVGRFSRALAKRFSNVCAVDVSEEMVNLARKFNPSDQYPNLQFNTTDGNSISCLPVGCIDFAFSYEVFQHMPSVEVILNNLRDIRRVLRPEGIAFIHLRTEPISSVTKVKRLIKGFAPEWLLRFFGMPPLTFDPTWSGKSLSHEDIQELCNLASLKPLKLIADPTHPPGKRTFLLAKPT